MSGDPDGSSDSEPNITVDDPEDYNLSRRFQQIHRAREYVLQVRRESGKEASRGDMAPGRYREELAQAVADYGLELKWIALDEDELPEPVERLWETEPVEAPEHPDDQLEGIAGFVDRYGVIEVEEEVEYDSPVARNGQSGIRESQDAPTVETTMRIYDRCNRLMKELGLEVKVRGEAPGPDGNPVDPAGRFDE